MKNKIYTSGLTLIVVWLMSCSSHLVPNTFLIPAGYEGIVRVIFDEKCGTTPKIENGRQILEFQNNGLLILNTKSFFNNSPNTKSYTQDRNGNKIKFVNKGVTDDYYLVDNKGNKTKIIEIAELRNRVVKTPVIVAGNIAVTDLSSTTNSESTVTTGITYQDFYLYNKDTREIKADAFPPKMDSLTKAVVHACQGGK